MTLAPTVIARFWAKVDKTSHPNGCWIWTGAYNTPKKLWKGARTRRPVFKLASNLTVYAHRLVLSIADGIPLWERQGLEACHECNNTQCVNHNHLYWGTRDQNTNDRYPVDGVPVPLPW